MKKENILVMALIVIAVGAVYLYNGMKSPDRSQAGIETAGPSTEAMVDNSGSGIGWKDYTPGMAQAREKDKSIFLYFHAPWCTYCTKLKKTTFADEKIISYLNENFVSIQVNTDQSQALASRWQVTGLPTMWFLDSQGKRIERMPGYVTADQLLQILKFIHTKSYTTMEFREFVNQG